MDVSGDEAWRRVRVCASIRGAQIEQHARVHPAAQGDEPGGLTWVRSGGMSCGERGDGGRRDRRAERLADAVELHLSHFRLAPNSRATYAPVVDGSGMASEREVNRFTDFTGERSDPRRRASFRPAPCDPLRLVQDEKRGCSRERRPQ